MPNARDRNSNTRDQRLDTLIHMQAPTPTPPATTTNVTTPVAWEYALLNGAYLVTVAVGDPSNGADASRTPSTSRASRRSRTSPRARKQLATTGATAPPRSGPWSTMVG